MAAEKKKASFEDKMLRLEEVVRLLERGDAPLEDAMKLFEEGTGLIRSCSRLLDEAEQKVVALRKTEDGTPEELPFQPEEQA